MTSTLPRVDARSRAVLAAFFLASLSQASCGKSGESAGEVKVSTAAFAADCCMPDQHIACQDGRWCNGEEQCDCWGNCEVGAPPNCYDGDMCTDDSCVDDVVAAPGTGVGTGHCQHVCVPGPTCICEECNVPADCDDGDACTDDACVDHMCQYGDTNCDDGDYCTDDTCDSVTGCQHTVRPGCCTTATQCDDMVVCTIDDCELSTHTCTHTLQDGFCEIAGICYADGTVNPSNECESCQYVYQTDRWTGLAAGTPCEDDLYCTLDQACDGDGHCVGAGTPCTDDGLTCTETVCNEATNTCFNRVYDGFCLIGGVCNVNGNENPANDCQRCWSTTSKTAWSPVPAGTDCDDSLFCTQTDQCNGLGSCVGAGTPCTDDGLTCTETVCNEASKSCSHPVSANRCLIGGNCYTNGDIDAPPNHCRWCFTATSQTAWTNRPNGTSCDVDGAFCDGIDRCNGLGTCVLPAGPSCDDGIACTDNNCNEVTDTCGFDINDGSCYIGGNCYVDNDSNPLNVCQLCWSATTKVGWSNRPDGPVAGCTGAIDQCNNRSCIGGACGVVANTGAPCTYLPDVCHDPGSCLSDGTCSAGPHVYPTNDACPNTISIAIDGSVSGSTLCAVDNYYLNYCQSWSIVAGAPDLVYEFTIPVSNDYQLYAHNVIHVSPFDGFIYARNTCTEAGGVYCNDDCVNTPYLTCASYGLDAQDSGLSIPVMRSDQSKTWYLVADGYNAAAYGNFTLTVDRVNANNSSCSTLADTGYVVDATAGGTFRGNIVGYTNTLLCPYDSTYLGNRCDCESGDSVCPMGTGIYASSSANPARAWFKVAPSSATSYCIYTNETAPSDPFDTVIDAWRMVEADEYTNDVSCNHIPRAMNSGTAPAGGCNHGDNTAPAVLQINSVPGGEVRFVSVSRYCSTTPGTQYQVTFVPNPSSCP